MRRIILVSIIFLNWFNPLTASSAEFICYDNKSIMGLKWIDYGLEIKTRYNPLTGETERISTAEEAGLPPGSGYFKWEGPAEDCWSIAVVGGIEKGDATKLEWAMNYLRKGPIMTPRITLISPGGNLYEAMTMGRILRSRYVAAEASLTDSNAALLGVSPCGKADQPLCCASACAVAYFGAVRWKGEDVIGLHRPSLADIAVTDYMQHNDKMSVVRRHVEIYAEEVEWPAGALQAMYETPPGEVARFRIRPTSTKLSDAYPTSVQDWIWHNCRRNQYNDIDFCADTLDPSEEEKDRIARRIKWFAHKSTSQLREMIDLVGIIGPLQREAAREELERRHIKTKSHK